MAGGAGGKLVGRVVQWLANEVIVKGLSKNEAFQRFAVRSSETAQKALGQGQELAAKRGEMAKAGRTTLTEFITTFREEFTRGIGSRKQ